MPSLLENCAPTTSCPSLTDADEDELLPAVAPARGQVELFQHLADFGARAVAGIGPDLERSGSPPHTEGMQGQMRA